MLPRLDGITICTRIRARDPRTPILMLTARSEELDRVLGLEIGADEYVTKPFSVRELMARVKALLRRASAGREEDDSVPAQAVTIGDLTLDFDKRKVTHAAHVVELTVKEFDLLALFARNPGRTYSRTDLLSLVWGYQFEGYEHTVNSHINRLRAKIETDPGHPRYLAPCGASGTGSRSQPSSGGREMSRLFRSFYARLSTIFLLLILALGAGCIVIAFRSSAYLFDDVEQLLNRDTARSIADELRPIVSQGYSAEAVGNAIHYMMVLNPMVEIYLLDDTGRILAYFLNPSERIVRDSVDLAPLRAFVQGRGRTG